VANSKKRQNRASFHISRVADIFPRREQLEKGTGLRERRLRKRGRSNKKKEVSWEGGAKKEVIASINVDVGN